MQLYLFQQDLRIHDQPLLSHAMKQGSVIGLYIFHDAWYLETYKGIQKKSNLVLNYLYESVKELSINLNMLNITLIVRKGCYKDIINDILDTYNIERIYYEKLPGTEEDQLYHFIKRLNIKSFHQEMKPLYKTIDLPFSIEALPDIFTHFRKKIESTSIRFDIHESLNPQVPISIQTSFPDKEDLSIDHQSLLFKAGESDALSHLHDYFFIHHYAKTYKETRNGMLKFEDSTKFSPYLAVGSLSVNTIMNTIIEYEKKVIKNDSTYWIYFELLWRDYFYYVHKKHGNTIFSEYGLSRPVETTFNETFISAWMQGNTGFPLIDANIRQLMKTGYMSNRGRQNVANFFSKFLKQDWRIGAAFFESYLIDYDVSSNTLNWLYNAGLGNDPRENRMFHYITQGERYDVDRSFVRTFLPELKHVPDHLVYKVSLFSDQERETYQLSSYPKPIKRYTP